MARWKGGEAGGDGRGGERDPATPKGCQFRGIATVPRNRLRRSQNGATMVGMVARLWIVVSCIPLAVLSGCTTVNQSGTCVPGASVACACPTGQQGAQTCNSAGTFGVCQCSVPGATDAAPDVLKASLDQAPDTQGPEVGSGGAGGTSMPNPFAGGAGGNGGASSFSSSGGAGGVPNPFAGGASGTGGADTMPASTPDAAADAKPSCPEACPSYTQPTITVVRQALDPGLKYSDLQLRSVYPWLPSPPAFQAQMIQTSGTANVTYSECATYTVSGTTWLSCEFDLYFPLCTSAVCTYLDQPATFVAEQSDACGCLVESAPFSATFLGSSYN